MIKVVFPAGAQYPVVVVCAPISWEMLDNELYGVPFRRTDDGYAFAIWHAPRLVELFGDAEDDNGRAWTAWAIQRERNFLDIKRGAHPLLSQGPPWMKDYQREALALCRVSPIAAIFHEPGMGKTAVMIELLKLGIADDLASGLRFPRPTLVVGGDPTLLYDAWERELELRDPQHRIAWANLNTKRDLLYQHAALFMVARLTLVRRRASIRLTLQHQHVRRVIVDESFTMANPENRTHQVLLEDWGRVPERILLSGLPAPNNALEYWSQINFVAPGLLPLTAEECRAKFFKKGGGAPVLREDKADLFWGRIATVAVVRTSKGDPTRPQMLAPKLRYCELPEQPLNVRAAYELLRAESKQQIAASRRMYAAGRLTEKQKMGRIFGIILRRRELANGYIVDRSKKWQLVSTHKFDLLIATLREIGAQKCVIWMNFDEDFRVIGRHHPALAARSGFIWGATNQMKYRKEVLRRFRNEPGPESLQYLFANPASIRHGLTLFNPKAGVPCHNDICFNIDHSLDRFWQSWFRLNRVGQKHPLQRWILMTANTIEESIYADVINKRENYEEGAEKLK